MGFRSLLFLPLPFRKSSSLCFYSCFFFFFFLFFSTPKAQETPARLDDLLLREYAFHRYRNHRPKTGHLYSVQLPSNLSGITATTARYRLGSLRRYGARINEFLLYPGTTIKPHVKRLIVVRYRIDSDSNPSSSPIFNVSGFRILSPVLGFSLYNGDDVNSRNASQVDILATERPILIDFSNGTEIQETEGSVYRPVCAFWGRDGKAKLSEFGGALRVCFGVAEGLYAVVVVAEETKKEKGEMVSRWKILVGSSIGAFLGAVLLGLLLVAVVKKKKRLKMAEMERRAYEEEALQVSMVGCVRAPLARGTRTGPVLESNYAP